MNRTELAAFLRSRRERLRPSDVGLPSGSGTTRRTPGLRRQEVAQLAGMSVDYYVRLEQGRGPKPSRQILTALTRALMLTPDEREYLFRMAGENPPAVAGPSSELLPATRYLLDSLHETPAYVVNARYDVLAWNAMATHFIGDLSGYPTDDRNIIRWMFRRAAADQLWADDDSRRFTQATIADLRAAYARYPGDPGIESLVTELLGVSPAFAQMWETREVEVRRGTVKRVEHPLAGPVVFECQVLHISDSDQRMIVYCAAPGSPTEAAFRRLAATTPQPHRPDSATPQVNYSGPGLELPGVPENARNSVPGRSPSGRGRWGGVRKPQRVAWRAVVTTDADRSTCSSISLGSVPAVTAAVTSPIAAATPATESIW